MLRNVVLLLAIAASTNECVGQQRKRPARRPLSEAFAGARVEVYKTIGDVELKMYIVEPEGHQMTDKTPAIVFFFGGGWRSGSPGQFAQHCKYLASRGMVAAAADYRVRSRHGTTADCCVRDAKSAVRWLRQNAERLGIDPERIAAGGGSAGGHIAACTGVVPGFEEEGEDTSISSVPGAMVLFNPALVLAPVEGVELNNARMASLAERTGVEPLELSPFHHVKANAPPTIIFHGEADKTVPFATAKVFAQAMKKADNDCRLHGYEGYGHGFFNHGRADGEMYRTTVKAMDEFLVELGYLSEGPQLSE